MTDIPTETGKYEKFGY